MTKPKFKVGDICKVIKSVSGGAKLGTRFVISGIHPDNGAGNIIYYQQNGKGTYENCLQLTVVKNWRTHLEA